MENQNEKNVTEFMKYVIYKFEQCEYMPEPVKFKNGEKYISLVLRQNPLDPESPVLSLRAVDLTLSPKCAETEENYKEEILRQEKATKKRRNGRTKTESALIGKAIKEANTECGLSAVNSYSISQKKQATINSRRQIVKDALKQQTTKTTERTR